MTYTERQDSVARLRADGEGQGELTVNGDTLLSFWACAICGLPIGSKERCCPHHPDAALFLRHVRERRTA